MYLISNACYRKEKLKIKSLKWEELEEFELKMAKKMGDMVYVRIFHTSLYSFKEL